MKTAIIKAVEGGWQGAMIENGKLNMMGIDHDSQFLLDPLFWQSLGNALKWPTYSDKWNPDYMPFEKLPYPKDLSWRVHWHYFIDHLAEGHDAESFFNELLK